MCPNLNFLLTSCETIGKISDIKIVVSGMVLVTTLYDNMIRHYIKCSTVLIVSAVLWLQR